MDVSKYFKFVLLNFILVAFFVSVVLIFFNLGHGMPYKMLFVAYSCALVIILAQYPILLKAKKRYLKCLVFFVSMNLFLFLYGESLCFIEECIGDFPGLKMVVFGNMLGAIIGFVAIVLINYKLRKYLF